MNGLDIVEQDLLTLVHVFEVDPVLRNKKITFTEFKNYLDQYYPNESGGTFSGNVTINGNLTVSVLQITDAGNIQIGTTTGTKIGTATTQKIGFYNTTPVVQPTAVADATDAATAITQLNLLLGRIRTLGLIAP